VSPFQIGALERTLCKKLRIQLGNGGKGGENRKGGHSRTKRGCPQKRQKKTQGIGGGRPAVSAGARVPPTEGAELNKSTSSGSGWEKTFEHKRTSPDLARKTADQRRGGGTKKQARASRVGCGRCGGGGGGQRGWFVGHRGAQQSGGRGKTYQWGREISRRTNTFNNQSRWRNKKRPSRWYGIKKGSWMSGGIRQGQSSRGRGKEGGPNRQDRRGLRGRAADRWPRT